MAVVNVAAVLVCVLFYSKSCVLDLSVVYYKFITLQYSDSIELKSQNWLMSWYDHKEVSLGGDDIGWISIKKTSIQKKKLSYIYIYKEKTKQKLVVSMLK